MIGRTSASARFTGRTGELPRPGDYLTDGMNLYCVEELFEQHALVEDCRTGVLIDVTRRDLLALGPVKGAAAGEAEGPEAEQSR
ncbi:MAG TPA: hypothetical protein VK919_09550 [Solirubrobacterales bacterium]|nr:hypothetical protein [Solirubrobacterales bacterium]